MACVGDDGDNINFYDFWYAFTWWSNMIWIEHGMYENWLDFCVNM